MPVIVTKHLGPTDYKGSRVKATATSGRSVTLEWDAALSSDANHESAARALILKVGWEPSDWKLIHCGDGPGGKGAQVWALIREW